MKTLGKAPPVSDAAIVVRALQVERSAGIVLDDIDFSVARGQLVGLLGPSGSGKTTLIRTLLGLQRVTSGEVNVLGASAGDAQLRRRVGYVSQALSVYVDLTVIENLRYFAAMLDAPRRDPERVVEIVGLARYTKTLVRELSGGERARVSLAAALLGEPELLLLDEPTVGLDPLLRQDLWTNFSDLAKAGTTLLISSHVMDEAARCERLLLLREGHILADLTPAQFLSTTGDETYDRAFVTLIERRQ